MTEDCYAKENKPTTTSNGTKLNMRAAGSGSEMITYIKFTVTGVGTPSSVILKVFSVDVNMGVDVYASASNSWSETSLNWNNQPGSTGSSVDFVNVTTGWTDFDVTSLVSGNGTYTFVLKGDANASGRNFDSDSAANPAELEVT